MLIPLSLTQDLRHTHGVGMIKDSVQEVSNKSNRSIEETSQSLYRRFLMTSSNSVELSRWCVGVIIQRC